MKFHEEASTIADHIPTYFLKLHRDEVLFIFTLYYQDMASEAKQINGQTYYKDELELNEAINNKVNAEQILDDNNLVAKKCTQICKEDNTIMASYKTLDYSVKGT